MRWPFAVRDLCVRLWVKKTTFSQVLNWKATEINRGHTYLMEMTQLPWLIRERNIGCQISNPGGILQNRLCWTSQCAETAGG